MKQFFICIFLLWAPFHLNGSELSIFSLKKQNLFLSIPKIWKWKYYDSSRGSSQTLFKAKSRNGHFYLGVFSEISIETKEKIELYKDKGSSHLDISLDEFPFLKSRQAILTQYQRKKQVGYFLQFENQKSRIYLILEVKSTHSEKEINFLKDIFQGIEGLDS